MTFGSSRRPWQETFDGRLQLALLERKKEHNHIILHWDARPERFLFLGQKNNRRALDMHFDSGSTDLVESIERFFTDGANIEKQRIKRLLLKSEQRPIRVD
jgi:hypothetical protein